MAARSVVAGVLMAAAAVWPRPAAATLTCSVTAAGASSTRAPISTSESWPVESRNEADGSDCHCQNRPGGGLICPYRCYTAVTVTDTNTDTDTNDRIAYSYVALRSDSCAADAAAMTVLLGASGAFRCSSEHDCAGTAPAHPDPDISMCDGDGSDDTEIGFELLMTPAGASCEAAAEGLDRRFRDMPRAGDGAAAPPLHLPDFYCDGYLPLLQLRDCAVGVGVVNEMIQSIDAANTSTAPTIAEPAAPPTLGPTATPTATPRDALAEVDALRAEVVSLRARMSELEEAATVSASDTRDKVGGDGGGSGGGSGGVAIVLAVIAMLLAAAAAAVVVRKHREITATLQAQIDLQTTGGSRPHELGMVNNPVFTPRGFAASGDATDTTAEEAGRGDPQDDGYLAVGTGRQHGNLQPDAVFYDTVDTGGSIGAPGSQSPSPSGTHGAREAGRGQQQGGVYSHLGNATYGQSQPQLSAGAHVVLTTGAGEQSGSRRGVLLQGSAYNCLGEA